MTTTTAAGQPVTSSTLSPVQHQCMSADGALPIEWVEALFQRMASIIGASKVAGMIGSQDPDVVEGIKAEWAAQLAGLSAVEVKRGLDAMKRALWAPTLPEFMRLCRPVLDNERAWIEAAEGMAAYRVGQDFEWSHPAVYWAARDAQYELRCSTYRLTRARWDALMDREWARAVWPPVPRAMAQIECAPPAPPVRTGPGRARLQAARAALVERQHLGEVERLRVVK